MKRILKVVGAVLLVVILAVAGVLAVTFMGRQPIQDGQEFSGMRVIQDGFTSVGVIPINDRQVALVDTGQDSSGEVIKRELARRQLQPGSVAAILVTHGHVDHIGALGQFPEARVMALEAEVPLVEGRAGAKGPVPRLFPVSPTGVTVDQVLHDGEVVMLDTLPVRVYAVPGHTAGSAAYLVNGRRVAGLGSVSDLPAEAIVRVEVLPRGAEVSVGARPGQRVYNIALRRELDLATVKVPTLVLQCAQDVIAPPEVGAYVHAQIPGSVLVSLDATGHCPQLSAPRETAEQIIAFGSSG